VKALKVPVIVGGLLVLVVVGAVLYVILGRGDSSNVVTRTVRGSDEGDANTISLYAPNQLSTVLERVTTAFQQENPGTTFEFTLGPSSELAERIQEGQKPSLYIDQAGGIGYVSAKEPPERPPIPLGHDIVQLAVKGGNPKQVNGLDAFANGSPVNSGICAPELVCGRADAEVLRQAGVNAAPKVVTNNVSDLTEGVATGRIDAVLALRTELRRVITGITNVRIPQTSRIDYQMAQYRSGGPTDQFVQWLQGSPNARQILRLVGMLSFYDR
jgi:molybdate transport system substrate-binding protein